MTGSEEGTDGDMRTMIQNDNANNNNNNDIAMMSDSSSKASMDTSDDSIASIRASDESNRIGLDHNGQSGEFMNNDNGNGRTEIMDME